MTRTEMVQKTADHMKEKFGTEATGHDWWHMYRVWKLAKHIGKQEKDVDMLVVELGALLHDIADWKFHDDEEAGPRAAREWLESIGADETVIAHIEEIIRNVSFKGANVKNKLDTIEGQIIYDADKLDAMGAIGIARTFAYAGANEHIMYDPDRTPVFHDNAKDFKYDKTGAINHFYEKLLLLKERMYTKTGKQLAEHRHEVMEQFLKEFHEEWEGDF